MMESLSKLVFAGLGALCMTRERAEKIFEECVRRGETEKEHRSKFVQDLMDAAERARQDTEKLIAEQVERVVSKMNLPTREDFARLEEKLDRLGGQDSEAPPRHT